jgi:hypothetical protein
MAKTPPASMTESIFSSSMDARIESDLAYWRQQLAGAPALLDLPCPYQKLFRHVAAKLIPAPE